MDSVDILEDKDSGPEVPINFPSSVMSRIEEMMGGTDQFDSAEFDAVAYINQVFPTEQSLSGVESAAARCEFHLAGVEHDIRRLVRAQAEQRETGQKALMDAQKCIAELALQVADINKKAERSESMVREITSEIKQLDCAKWNLTGAITALNHLHMLAGGTDTLRSLARARQYKEIVLPMQAIMEVLQHFECYRDIRELTTLRDQVHTIRSQLATQILADFKEAFTGGGKGGVAHRALADACAVLDVLEPAHKQHLLTWFIDLQLQEYAHLFAADQESAWVSHVERRYAWLKRHLLAFEESLAHVFPPAWRLSERITQTFCKMTRTQLGEQLAARRDELDVKLLLFAIQKTYNFELLLHKRFTGTDLDAENAEINIDKQPSDTDVKDTGSEAPASVWVGLIGGCFEPYLSLYITSLDQNLRSLMDRFIQDAKASSAAGVGEGVVADTGEAGAVISSCADLFLFYKKCLVQCARLSTGEPMLELAGVFQKYLREYSSAVLQASLPRAGAGAAPGPVPSLVTGLHSLLRDDLPDTRYSPREIATVTSVITTAEYCLETTVHLEQKLREKVAPALASRVDLANERRLFHELIDGCTRALVRDLELACEPSLQAMARVPWSQLRAVGDQSAHIATLVAALRSAVPILRDRLAASRKYFTQLCIRFADSFIPKFMQALYRCRGVSTAGAEQLLLDAHTLKTALLELPAAGASVRRAPPATYTRLVLRLMTRAEMTLKLVLAPLDPPEQFAAHALRLLPDCSLAEFHRVLDMKGAKLPRAHQTALDAHFRRLAENAQAEREN